MAYRHRSESYKRNNSKKEKQKLEDEKVYKFVAQKIRSPNGNLRLFIDNSETWREFKRKNKATKSITHYQKRFDKVLLPKLGRAPLSDRQKLDVFWAVGLPITDDFLDQVETSCQVKCDNQWFVVNYKNMGKIEYGWDSIPAYNPSTSSNASTPGFPRSSTPSSPIHNSGLVLPRLSPIASTSSTTSIPTSTSTFNSAPAILTSSRKKSLPRTRSKKSNNGTEEYTQGLEYRMWLYLDGLMRDPVSNEPSKLTVNLLTWEQFALNERKRRSLMYYQKRFKEEMCPNLHKAHFTFHNKLELYWACQIPVNSEYLKKFHEGYDLTTDRRGIVLIYSQKTPDVVDLHSSDGEEEVPHVATPPRSPRKTFLRNMLMDDSSGDEQDYDESKSGYQTNYNHTNFNGIIKQEPSNNNGIDNLTLRNDNDYQQHSFSIREEQQQQSQMGNEVEGGTQYDSGDDYESDGSIYFKTMGKKEIPVITISSDESDDDDDNRRPPPAKKHNNGSLISYQPKREMTESVTRGRNEEKGEAEGVSEYSELSAEDGYNMCFYFLRRYCDFKVLKRVQITYKDWDDYKRSCGDSHRPVSCYINFFYDKVLPKIQNGLLEIDEKLKLLFVLKYPVDMRFINTVSHKYNVETNSEGVIEKFSEKTDDWPPADVIWESMYEFAVDPYGKSLKIDSKSLKFWETLAVKLGLNKSPEALREHFETTLLRNLYSLKYPIRRLVPIFHSLRISVDERFLNMAKQFFFVRVSKENHIELFRSKKPYQMDSEPKRTRSLSPEPVQTYDDHAGPSTSTQRRPPTVHDSLCAMRSFLVNFDTPALADTIQYATEACEQTRDSPQIADQTVLRKTIRAAIREVANDN